MKYFRRQSKRPIIRTDVYTAVSAENEHECRISMVRLYVDRGKKVVSITVQESK